MCKVIDFREARRARRQTHDRDRRAHLPGHDLRHGRGLVSIGVVSSELVRRLTED